MEIRSTELAEYGGPLGGPCLTPVVQRTLRVDPVRALLAWFRRAHPDSLHDFDLMDVRRRQLNCAHTLRLLDEEKARAS